MTTLIEINGDSGNNTLVGTDADELLSGLEGQDILEAGAGNDTVLGGKGNDTFEGGAGDDILIWADGDGSDIISGNDGQDVVGVTGSVSKGDNFVLGKNAQDEAFFERVGLDQQLGTGVFTMTVDTSEIFDVQGNVGDDTFEVNDLADTGVELVKFLGGKGNDTLQATETSVTIQAGGGRGADNLVGGAGNDTLGGGRGGDTIAGGKGSDTMNGDKGADRLLWDDGEGSDIISGGAGNDVVVVNTSKGQDDEFVLQQDAGKAIFDRVNVGLFTLTTDTVEQFEVNADVGNDILTVNSLSNTSVDLINFSGGDGNDILRAFAADVDIVANGGAGTDLLSTGSGRDVLVGGDGVDTLIGGAGADQFVYLGNVFSGTPTAAANGINVLNTPDIIQDFNIKKDQFVFNAADLGIDAVEFQQGVSSEISSNGNVIVLKDAFANAAAAAKAIADNNNITEEEGVFVYFNSTLQITRVVYSANLGEGGDISVLANLTNQAGNTGLTGLTNFSANNFTVA